MRVVLASADFMTSVEKSLAEIDKNWKSYPGLIVVGSHTPLKVDEKLAALREARDTHTPTLGICLGMQLMAVEYAKNVMHIRDATSEEFGRGTFVVKKMPQLRVGAREVNGRLESHWHNYRIADEWAKRFSIGWDLIETRDEGNIVEIMSLKSHPFYVGTQFHPEYGSSKKSPHPVLKQFLAACKNV